MKIMEVKGIQTGKDGFDIFERLDRHPEKTKITRIEIIRGDGINIHCDERGTLIIPKVISHSMITRIGEDVITIVGVI